MANFPKYTLTSAQIKGIANIVKHEQGTEAGRYAEASQIANRTDMKGDAYATAANVVKQVKSGWYANGAARFEAGTTDAACIKIVKDVFCEGRRTLPRYVDEHDYIGDIASAKNGSTNVLSSKSKWTMHKTIIKNNMGSTYTFYSFPGGYSDDPFGYTSATYRTKWGDDCYTVEEAKTGFISYKAKITASSGLNVRKTASTSSSVLTTIPYGATITITAADGNWGKTTYNGKTGWVYLTYTKKFK